jgi:hypothetical protein
MPRKSPLDDDSRRLDLLILIRQGVKLAIAAERVGSSLRAVQRYGEEKDPEFAAELEQAIEDGRARDVLQDADGSVLVPVRVRGVEPDPEPLPDFGPAEMPAVWVGPESVGETSADAGAEAPGSAGESVVAGVDGPGSKAPPKYSRDAARELAWARWVNADGSVPMQLQIAASRMIGTFTVAEMRIEAARMHLMDVERVRVAQEQARAMMAAGSEPGQAESTVSQVSDLEIIEIPSNGTEAPGRAPLRMRPETIDAEVVETGTG